MSKLIPLTRGHSAIVDDDDYSRIIEMGLKWYANKDHHYDRYYAIAHGKTNYKKILSLHRVVLEITDRTWHVDHINHDALDNRRENLRIVTPSQNQMNRQSHVGTSRYKGVSWDNNYKAWVAKIKREGKQIYMGKFKTEVEAALAYDLMAIELFGEFANINLPHVKTVMEGEAQ